MRSIIGIGLLGMVLLTGCVFWGDSYHKKEVSSFVLDPKDNPGLSQTIRGRVDHNTQTITLRFPNTVALQSLVPRFQYVGLRATLDGIPWESGSRAIDFSQAHTLEIAGVDEDVLVYRFQVSLHAKVFTEFSFSTAQNPLLANSITLGWQALGLTYEDYWTSKYDWFHGYWTPATAMHVYLPADTPTALVPTFSHNAVSVRWNGQPLVSGVTALDTSADQVLTLVGADGSTQDVSLQFTYQPLALTSFELLVKDNPTLRKDYQGTLNASTKVVSLAIPNYVDATTLVARFAHNGTKVQIDGLEATSGTTKIDLSKNQAMTVIGLGNRTQGYQILVVPVPPAGSKQILSRSLYGSVYRTPPFLPTSSDELAYYYETSQATDHYTLTLNSSSYSKAIDPSLVYLEIQTTAIQVSVGGQALVQGLLDNDVYSPANWLNFNGPVVLTLTAEDLTTKTVTLNLVVK